MDLQKQKLKNIENTGAGEKPAGEKPLFIQPHWPLTPRTFEQVDRGQPQLRNFYLAADDWRLEKN